MRRLLSDRRFLASLVGTVLTVAIVFGAVAIFTEVNAAGRCICPQVYAPVVCDNGKTYPNLCVANCRNAKNCEPIFIVPPVPY